MANTATSTSGVGREQALDVGGALVATAELRPHPATYQPPDQLWLFRGEHAWTLLTIHRTERWSDDGRQELHRCHARAVTESFASIDGLADRIRGRYGESGWHLVLAAGTADPDLYRAWVPGALERELEDARFFREDLVASIGRFTSGELAELSAEIEHHLRVAHFQVVAVSPPTRPTRPGENLVMANAIVRKYGFELVTIIRMDSVGEVYFRVADEPGARRPVLRDIEDDDG